MYSDHGTLAHGRTAPHVVANLNVIVLMVCRMHVPSEGYCGERVQY